MTLPHTKHTPSTTTTTTTKPRFAELEVMLSEAGRARGLFELAIQQPVLDMPEAVWKAYIDFEISQVGGESVRESV